MTPLVFGRTGQVAQRLIRLCQTDTAAQFLGRDLADRADPAACADAIHVNAPNVMINAAAWTAVDRAKTEENAASAVNGAVPTAMARACVAMGIPSLHLSTDYVYGGSGDRPFAPDHPTAPLRNYGRSKLVGEIGGRYHDARHLTLRTSWVVSAHGANLVKTMLRLGAERGRLTRRLASRADGGTCHAGWRCSGHLSFCRRPRSQLGQFRQGHHGRGGLTL